MTDIIDFPEPKRNNIVADPTIPLNRIMLVCNCGCETFALYADGGMKCAYCNDPVDPETEKTWRERMPDPSPEELMKIEADDDVKVRNIFYGNPEMARRRVMRELSLWSDLNRMALVIGYNIDGTGQSWTSIETEEQREWVLRKIDSLRQYVVDKSIESIGHAFYRPVEDAEDVETAGQESTAQETSGPAVEGDTQAPEGGASGSGDASAS